MNNQLTQQQLELLVELNSQNELGMRTYSGRGMYGEYCLAFAGEDLLESLSNELFGSVTDVDQFKTVNGVEQDRTVTEVLDDVDKVVKERLEFFQMFLNPRQDSMGLGTIVYFPSIKLTKEQIEFINNEVE